MTGQTASTLPGRGTAPGGDHADPVANAVGEAATDATRPRLAQPGAPPADPAVAALRAVGDGLAVRRQ